jgi:DHA1 family multidrug resistance protein-like MFS transporter
MSRALIFVILAVFLLVTGTFISGTILTPYAQKIGATWFQIGILSGSMYVVRLFVSTSVGRLADKKGVLTVLKYSLMLYPIIAIAYWFSSNIYSLIFARLLHGLASAMMLPMGMAYMGQAAPKGEEGRYIAIYNFYVLLASGIGPLISTIIAGFYHYRATFATLFVLAIMALAILWFSPNGQSNEIKRYDNGDVVLKERLNSIQLLRNPKLMALSMANVALSVISSLVGFFLIPFLKGKGIDLVLTGSIIAIYNIVSGVSQIPLGKIIDKYNKFLISLSSGIITSVALLIFPLIKNVWIFTFAIFVVSLGSAALLAGASALSVIVGRETGMGTTMGFLSTANSIGMIFGCISLGLLPGTGHDYDAFFIFSSLALIVCIVLFAILWSVKKSCHTANI